MTDPFGRVDTDHVIAEQQREIERLRAALHRIGLPLAQITYCRDGHEEAVLIARAALATQPQEQK